MRELREYAAQNDRKLEDYDVREQDADVVVTLGDEHSDPSWVVVHDCGVGMKKDTILKYFLTAGASFRDSDEWKAANEDDEGGSRVLRAGRFGVGALAAFLLGPEIHVCTRHVADDVGVRFAARIGTDPVELSPVATHVGTTVKVRIDAATREYLEVGDHKGGRQQSWDWYCLGDPEPTVRRIILPGHTAVEQASIVPPPCEHGRLPARWHRLPGADDAKVLWSYAEGGSSGLTHNGIRVCPASWAEEEERTWGRRVVAPSVAIFDPGGRVGLNLQRTELDMESRWLAQDLLESVVRDLLAFAIVRTPEADAVFFREHRLGWRLRYPGLTRADGDDMLKWVGVRVGQWCWQHAGVGLTDPHITRSAGLERILWIDPGLGTGLRAAAGTGVIAMPVPQIVAAYGPLLESVAQTLDAARFVGMWFLGRRGEADADRTFAGMGIPDTWAGRVAWQEGAWFIAYAGSPPEAAARAHYVTPELCTPASETSGSATIVAAEYLFGPPFGEPIISDRPIYPEDRIPSIFAQMWEDTIRHPVIPYGLDERHDKLAHAYEELAGYIKKWEAYKDEDW